MSLNNERNTKTRVEKPGNTKAKQEQRAKWEARRTLNIKNRPSAKEILYRR